MVGPTIDKAGTLSGIRPIDQAFAEFIRNLELQHPDIMANLAAILSNSLGQQNTCVAIARLDQSNLKQLGVASQDDLRKKLQQANTVVINGAESSNSAPIIFENDNLYLQRYYFYEVQLAALIRQRCSRQIDLDHEQLKPILKQLFSAPPSNTDIDWQQIAVCIAAGKYFSMITGGPGTGKTTTVARLLGLISTIPSAKQHKLTIKLVAPTGKAAARLSESLANARRILPQQFHAALDVECGTIHRLLGTIPNSISFRHHLHNPLHLDLLVVDEASMVDLPLMYKLISAVPEHGRIVLLGDPKQLSSVEAGSVLSDMCKAAQGQSSLSAYSTALAKQVEALTGFSLPVIPGGRDDSIADCLVVLQESHRFSQKSDIGKLARLVIEDELDGVITTLMAAEFADVSWHSDTRPGHLIDQVVPRYEKYFTQVKQGELSTAFEALQGQQILCAQRSGSWGVAAINLAIEVELGKGGIIDLSSKDYSGRPIMLTENDHSLSLYNGDIGILMPDPVMPELKKAWFSMPDGTFKGVLISRLPAFETVYAMTIHKSQGSEFGHAFLCLPDTAVGNSQRGLSKELFYTALTRARHKFTLYSPRSSLIQCLTTQCRRSSGLAVRLSPME